MSVPTPQRRPKRTDHLWKKGCSGNPRGRPKGIRNKSTLAAQLTCQGILNEEAVPLIRKALKMALSGDAKCLKLCIERILPPLKEQVEERQVQHAIEVTLKEPLWLAAQKPLETITTIDANGEETNDHGQREAVGVDTERYDSGPHQE